MTCPAADRELRGVAGRYGDGRGAEQQQLRDGPGRRGRRSGHVQLVELDVHAAGRHGGAVRRARTGAGGPAPGTAAARRRRTPPRAARLCCARRRPRRTCRSSGAVADSNGAPGAGGIESAYVAFADVTALVRAGGAGPLRRSRTCRAGPASDRYAGWSLVVVYRDPALPLRNLTVFDGLATIEQNEPPLQIGVSGFKTPVSGPVRTSVGLVAYEGDRGSSGDRLALNGRDLTDAANPANNVFNSSVSFQGTNTITPADPAVRERARLRRRPDRRRRLPRQRRDERDASRRRRRSTST